MNRLLTSTAVLLGGCMTVNMQTGARISYTEAHARRADLRGLVAEELGWGRTGRAFYALELLKTREFAAPRLASERGEAAVMAAYRDLRPLLGEPIGDEPAPERVAVTDKPKSRQLRLKPGSPSTPAGMGALRDRGDELFWEHLRLYDARVKAMVPYGHGLKHTYAITSSDEAGRMFGPDEAFVSFFVRGDVVHAFALRGGRLVVRRLPTSARELQAAVGDLHARVSGRASWRQAAETVYRQLLGPIEADLGSDLQALYVSPDGFLANVPLAVLIDGRGRMLVERARIALLPSASVHRVLLQRPDVGAVPRLLAVGDPQTSFTNLDRLEYADREADTIADVYDETELLAGDAATEGRVLAAMRDHNILHFATHWLLIGGALPGASSLVLAADDEHDGLLNTVEIAALDLRKTDLAVLSACQTSVSESEGSVGLASLSGAFLTAGVPTVIGSLWPVDDVSTTALMLDFYQRFLELGAGQALREAQLAVSRRAGWEHPYFWAAFVLFGWDK